MQFLNSETTVNFNHRVSEHYIGTLYERSKKYKKANNVSINVHKMNAPKGFDNFTAQIDRNGSFRPKHQANASKIKLYL